MRICILTARFPPQRCGVGDYSYFLGRSLAAAGQEVHILTSVGAMDEVLHPVPYDVHVHRSVTGWGLRELPGIVRRIVALRPDHLLLQYAPTAFDPRGITVAINLIPSFVRSASSIRVIANFHELFVPFGFSPKNAAQAIWQRAAGLLLASTGHDLCVTSSNWRTRLRGMGVAKEIRVIPVGSNIPLAQVSNEERLTIRRRLLGGSDGLLLCGFGSQHDRDIPSILYGLRQLKEMRLVKLVWVGGGIPVREHRERVQAAIDVIGLASSDVEWTGELPHPEVSKLLSSCDMMLLPFTDGISSRRTTAMAALQHGLPLMTTLGQNNNECHFIHRENVFLVPAGDREALAQGMVEMAERPDLRSRLGQAARALYDQSFSWDIIAQRVLGLMAAS